MRIKTRVLAYVLSLGMLGLGAFGLSDARAVVSEALPCDPVSEYLIAPEGGPSPAFCARWNPEYAARGHRCCPKPLPPGTRVARKACPKGRAAKKSYCDEITAEQRAYLESHQVGAGGDLLKLITHQMGRRTQAYCDVNAGFLAFGRPVAATEQNRLKILAPDRCLNFGTDPMIGMLEWVGRQVGTRLPAREYPGALLPVGAVSAPRGGCLAGKNGKRGHASHTNGQDVDLGFLVPRKTAGAPEFFERTFDPKLNWWLLKQVFQNPFACIKVVFLDRKLIQKLTPVASKDPEWFRYKRFVRHMRGHKNHFHIRVGNGPGQPGCVADSHPELEFEEDWDALTAPAPAAPSSADEPDEEGEG